MAISLRPRPGARLMAALVTGLVLLGAGSGCRSLLSRPAPSDAATSARSDNLLIGLSLATLKEERWQRDRDIFVARARQLGAVVMAQAAANDDALQIAQAENMVEQGADILVVVPHNAEASAAIVEIAHAAGVKVIAYDRMINGADVDYYISFDNHRVGELQARAMVSRVPRGSYALINGAYIDNNARMVRQGQLQVLQPLVEKGQIRIVYDEFTPDWQPEEARKHAEKALEATGEEIDAIIAGNDGTAGGIVAALTNHGLAGDVPVAGQDADLAAIRRIVAGTQTVTVYKPIKQLAEQAADIAVAMIGGEEPPVNAQVDNGYKAVPAYLLEPVLIHRGNIEETIIRDGFHRREEIFGPNSAP